MEKWWNMPIQDVDWCYKNWSVKLPMDQVFRTDCSEELLSPPSNNRGVDGSLSCTVKQAVQGASAGFSLKQPNFRTSSPLRIWDRLISWVSITHTHVMTMSWQNMIEKDEPWRSQRVPQLFFVSAIVFKLDTVCAKIKNARWLICALSITNYSWSDFETSEMVCEFWNNFWQFGLDSDQHSFASSNR